MPKNTRMNKHRLREHTPLEKGETTEEIMMGRVDILGKVTFDLA